MNTNQSYLAMNLILLSHDLADEMLDKIFSKLQSALKSRITSVNTRLVFWTSGDFLY